MTTVAATCGSCAHEYEGEVIGGHRVMCGDSLGSDLDRVLDVSVDVVFADPPYGIGLQTDYTKVGHGGGKRYDTLIGDEAPFDPAPILARCHDVAEQFWWGADHYRSAIPSGGSWTVWDKRGNDEGMDLDELFGSVFELCWSARPHRQQIARVLWAMTHGQQRPEEDARRGLHPTQKPVALALWFFNRWVPPGSVVLDPFLGSGTTLVAAHQHGAIVRACEISPAYVDVAVERWQRATNEKPILEATGEPHDFLAGTSTPSPNLG